MSRRPVMAGVATIPEREDSLRRTLASLLPQVDRLVVSLNDYDRVPAWLDGFPKVEATVRQENDGDAEKFAAVDDWNGVFLGCDDDILYPDDYVRTLVDGLDRYGHQHIVGFHGGQTLGFNGKPMAATDKIIRCLDALEHDDTDVNVLGTGALAFDTATVPLWRGVFRHPNMADVHLACHAKQFGIPMVALAHQGDWMKDIGQEEGRKIFQSNKHRDRSKCDSTHNRRSELKRHDWTTQAAVPRVRVSIATCERPQLLHDLLQDLVRERYVNLEVAVFEDPADADYTCCHHLVENQGWTWHRMPRRMGKQNFWRLVSNQYHACRKSDADWFVFLPDDIRLSKHALAKAIATWARLDNPSTLTLWRLKDHENQTNWTGELPVDRGDAFEVFHVDGIYLCQRPTLEFFNYACARPRLTPEQKRRWSSGVGRGQSISLHEAGRRMYRVRESLARPVPNVPSVMNEGVTDRRFQWVAL